MRITQELLEKNGLRRKYEFSQLSVYIRKPTLERLEAARKDSEAKNDLKITRSSFADLALSIFLEGYEAENKPYLTEKEK